MADENHPERNVDIQGSANINSATGQTSATGVKIERVTGNVHVHGDTTPSPSFRSVALVGVLAFLGAVLVNYATSLPLPESWKPYLWLSWPLAIFVTAASIWVAYRQSRRGGSSVVLGGSLEQRNRRAMLAKVKAIWVDGLLEHSLAKELRIALELTEQPDAVELPLNALVQELNHPPRPLPSNTPIIQVFDLMGGALLILGAPGAGKTTLLLELARDLIARAEQGESHPIPVVFNLSSWAEKRRPLKDWLVEELNTKYDVPRKVAQGWMDTDAVLPLLDGLDEVAAEHRGNCVEAINTYRQEHGLVPVSICSRAVDYEALTAKVQLQGAIVVQPLIRQQVDTYLERAGEKLAGVRTALHSDEELAELLDTPLMLSVVTLAYKDKSLAKIQGESTSDERRRHLFDAYITTMLKRRSKQTHYTPQQATCWLAWLSRTIVRDSQAVYYIERMQPDWLSAVQQRRYRIRLRTLGRLYGGLLGGLGVGLACWVAYGELVSGLAGGLIGGVVFALIVQLAFSKSDGRIKVTETLRWSWSRYTLLAGLGVWLGSELGSVLLAVLIRGRGVGLFVGLGVGLGVGLAGALLVGGLLFGLRGGELQVKARPNQGIHRSLRNSLLVGLFVGLVTWLGSGLTFGVDGRLGVGLGVGLGSGLMAGLLMALNYGAGAVLQHYTLRWLLYRNDSLPLRLVPFLDYCVDRIFLRKVGGGYIFVHRLLMEHFASLYTEEKPAEPVEGQGTTS